MKLAFSTLGCPGWMWRDILSAAADLGYDGIEMRGLFREMYVPNVSLFSPEAIQNTLATLQRLGLEIPCMTSNAGIGRKVGHLAAMDEARDYIDLAGRAGSPFVRVMGNVYAEPDEEPMDEGQVVEALQELGDYAAPQGVNVLLETNGYFADTKNLARVLKNANRPNVAALWDVHYPIRFFDEAPQETAGNLEGYVRYVHFKDSRMENGKIRYRILGDGDLPLEGFLAALRSIGYDGYISLEWVKRWDPTLEEPGVVLAHFVNKMKAMLGQA